MYEHFPRSCYTLLNTTGELIRIDRGVNGYMTYKHEVTGKKIVGMEAYEKAQTLNAAMGITDWRIIEAMTIGSMFSWDVKGAHPEAHKKLPDNHDPLMSVLESLGMVEKKEA